MSNTELVQVNGNSIQENRNEELVLTDEEKFTFVKHYDAKKTEGKNFANANFSNELIKSLCRKNVYDILSTDNKELEELSNNIPLEWLVQGIRDKFPEDYSDTNEKRALQNITEKIKINSIIRNVTGVDKLTIRQIDDILPKLRDMIDSGKSCADVSALCMNALKNPYKLTESTFKLWLDIRLKNGGDVFTDLSQIFASIEETEKNLTEKVFKDLLNSEKIKETKAEDWIKDQKEKFRRNYYIYGLEIAKNMDSWLPDEIDISSSLGSVNSFLKVLDKEIIPDRKNQLETIVTRLFKPGRVKIEIKDSTDSDALTILLNIFRIAIKYMVDSSVKRPFIEKMFAAKNCEQIAIQISKDIICASTIKPDDKKTGYDIETKKLIIKQLSELYENKNLGPEQLSTIIGIIIDFIIREKGQPEKEFAFELLSNILEEDKKKQEYAYIMTKDFDNSKSSSDAGAESYKIMAMHKEIQASEAFRNNEELKLNSINNLCKFYFDDDRKLDDTYKNTIMSFMAEIMIDYEKNTIAVRNTITEKFYQKFSSKSEEQKKFLTYALDKCKDGKEDYQTMITKLPQSIHDEILKIMPDRDKEELMIAIIDKAAGTTKFDDIIDYIVDDKNEEKSRRKVLEFIITKLKKSL